MIVIGFHSLFVFPTRGIFNMHIPDGYLSLQTSLPAFGVMAPVWSAAVNKLKKELNTRQVPLLSLSAAFSFVIMMFNIPVGMSSVHAVGAVFIAILMGPWAACLAVSVALIIQAFIFGDGGVLAIGANCFNMAFIMPFTGYFIYRAAAGKTAIGSKRSMMGVFLGSYIGINLAALFTAVEFGIQPLLFKTSEGLPLYGFYPLWVSVPAMMLEHLLIAGPVEGIVTVSAVAYILKVKPQLFGNRELAGATQETGVKRFRELKNLVLALVALIIAVPLGLFATGTAWGEWSSEELQQKIGFLPEGFGKLSGIWRGFIPDYAFQRMGSGALLSSMGYILSAISGVIAIYIIISLLGRLFFKGKSESLQNGGTDCGTKNTAEKKSSIHPPEAGIPEWLLKSDSVHEESPGKMSTGFLTKTLREIGGVIQHDILSERNVSKGGFYQDLDPRVKLVSLLIFITLAGLVRNLNALVVLGVISIGLAALSRLELHHFIARVWLVLPVIFFIVSLPAATNIIIKGNPVFYVYSGLNTGVSNSFLPDRLYFTAEGLSLTLKMALRIGVSLSYSYITVASTRWSELARSLNLLRIPKLLTATIDMAYRFISILVKAATELLEARYLRTVGKVKSKESRRFISNSMALIFLKAERSGEELYESMLCRGYSGEPVSLHCFKLSPKDYLWLLCIVIIISGIVML